MHGHRRPRRHPPRSACACCRAICAQLRRSGGELVTGARVAAIERDGGAWRVTTEAGRALFGADPGQRRGRLGRPGRRAGRRPAARPRSPSGGRSSPSTRRPARSSTRLPFAKTVGDELYFAPESGRLFASPMDEVPSEPCDAQPDEYEVALAAYPDGGADDRQGRADPQPLGGPSDLHARPPSGRRLRARCGGLLLAGGAGRVRAADLAGDGARSRRR